jgi:hypothetical protein
VLAVSPWLTIRSLAIACNQSKTLPSLIKHAASIPRRSVSITALFSFKKEKKKRNKCFLGPVPV